jgi:N-formylglutamate amidohydrolase
MPVPVPIAEIIRIVRSDETQARPVILSSPHSGRDYRDELCAQTPVPVERLRRSEDAYVDTLIEDAPRAGASLVCALFPRVFVDVNRAADELDPGMYRDRLAGIAHPPTRRVTSGLGVIPRVGAEGQSLYGRRLKADDAQARLATYYHPYHAGLAAEIERLRARFGYVIVLDMHSMPEHSAPGVDFVLGDRFGQSCDGRITSSIEAGLHALGFVTVRNTPYAGGHTTEHYGRPETGVHVIQIEISRALYLHEQRVSLRPEAEALREKLRIFINNFTSQNLDGLVSS